MFLREYKMLVPLFLFFILFLCLGSACATDSSLGVNSSDCDDSNSFVESVSVVDYYDDSSGASLGAGDVDYGNKGSGASLGADAVVNYVNDSSDNVSLGASSVKTKIIANDLSMVYGSGKCVVAYLKTSGNKAISGKYVKITINGKTYTKTTDSSGKVTLTIKLLPKTYSCKISFVATGNYVASSKTIKVYVKKYPTTIVAGNLVMSYKGKDNFIVTLKNSSNNVPLSKCSVSFKFAESNTIGGGSKTYTKTTNAKGQCGFYGNMDLKPGVYSCAISFSGSNYYAGSSKTVFVTIKKLSNVVVDCSRASTKNYLIAYLKDGDGNPISNKELVFVISNIGHSNVTDSKGMAKFYLNDLNIGNYSAMIGFGGNDVYSSSLKSFNFSIHEVREFKLNDVISSAKYVKDYVNKNHALPSSVTVLDKKCTIGDFAYLVSSAITNIYSNNTDDIIYLEGSYSHYNNGSCDSCEDFSLLHYCNLARNIVVFMDLYGYAPEIMSNVDIYCYVYTFSKILSFYQLTNYLPSEIEFNSNLSYNGSSYVILKGNISQFTEGLNEINTLDNVSKYLATGVGSFSEVTNTIRSVANVLTNGLTNDWDRANAIFKYVRDDIDYSSYSNSLKNATGVLITNKKANCCDKSNLIVALCRASGIAARYCYSDSVHFTVSNLTLTHVWTQILINGIWYSADATSSSNSLGNVLSWDKRGKLIQYDLLPF